VGLAVAQSAVEGVIEATGLRYWEWNADGVLFRLTQRLPDQTRAFFLARGFDADTADAIAMQCVFQSMFRNTGTMPGVNASIDLDDWIVLYDDRQSGLLTREYWEHRWRGLDVAPAAKIAFEWSLLPTRQMYAPGDYNWGMTSYGLPPGSTFNLVFSWQSQGNRFTGRLDNVRCPEDVHPPTE
jgi:hypothetical protein